MTGQGIMASFPRCNLEMKFSPASFRTICLNFRENLEVFHKPRGGISGAKWAHSFTISFVSESMTSLDSANELRREDGLDYTNLDDDC